MARASTPTILSLDGFAKIMAIPPVHFNGAIADTVWVPRGGCSQVWPQYAWQSENELVGREELAIAINEAEQDIKRVLGYAVAPEWIVQEVHEYPRYHRREMTAYGGDVRGLHKTIETNWSKVISPGQRAVSAIATGATVTYSDADGDGWKELATITTSTVLDSTSEIKVYFAGKSGAPEWEIRPVRSKSISGVTLTIAIDSWKLIDPDLWEAYPTSADFEPINIEGTTNFVATVDIYHEYADTTVTSATFYWEPSYTSPFPCPTCSGSGCSVCTLTTQTGCFAIRNAELGSVAPSPGSYDEDAGLWTTEGFTVDRDPDQVKLYYQAGNISQRFLASQTTEPIDDYLAQAVAYLAVARLEYPLCSCSNVRNVAAELRRDLTLSTSGNSYARTSNMDIFTNPFGTRKGEVMAWQRIRHLAANNWGGGVL